MFLDLLFISRLQVCNDLKRYRGPPNEESLSHKLIRTDVAAAALDNSDLSFFAFQ